MADRISQEHRSWNMSRIRGQDTKPEKIVRSTLHRMGYRFRLYQRNLPGRPDLVLPKHRTVIFVHGCFWHRHRRCKYAYTPKSRLDFWTERFRQNKMRDARAGRKLRTLGWKVVVIWECQISNVDRLPSLLLSLLNSSST